MKFFENFKKTIIDKSSNLVENLSKIITKEEKKEIKITKEEKKEITLEKEFENETDEGIILELDMGDNLEIEEEERKKLLKLGKYTTCKIITEEGFGSGFFCKIPFQNSTLKVLFTNHHVLKRNDIIPGKIIRFAINNEMNTIKITNNRKTWSNLSLDFTCIEIFDEDNIKHFYEIEYKDYDDPNKYYNNVDCAVIQFPNGGPIKLKGGHLLKIKKNIIFHSVSTDHGSSGSPIILLLSKFKVVGIHTGHNDITNQGIYIKHVVDLINKNEIECVYNITKNDLNRKQKLLNDNNEKKNVYIRIMFGRDFDKLYDLFLEGKKIEEYDRGYKFKEEGKYKLIIKCKKLLTDASNLFSFCDTFSVNLFNLNTIYITDMNQMFCFCKNLTSINLSHIKTYNVKDMSYMFAGCISLINLDVSSFITDNVINMSYMFNNCHSLTSLDLSNFNTKNVIDFSGMFMKCVSLEKLEISNFITNNAQKMTSMFSKCSKLEKIDLSKFNTTNVTQMNIMFQNCYSLKSLDLSNFNTENVEFYNAMFNDCKSLLSLNLINFKCKKGVKINRMFDGLNDNIKFICNEPTFYNLFIQRNKKI